MEVGARVEVAGKDVKGTVAYVGTTAFSSGKWVGVILDEPKGRNNGTVQGRTYFTCDEGHGIFVRQLQLSLLEEEDPQPSSTSETLPTEIPAEKSPDRPESRASESQLHAQVQDLQEKLDTLARKRQEDRALLKDYERTKLQLQQLLEFKTKISESQQELQRQLVHARREAQEAAEERDRHANELAELSETMEMATVEKEMAEEKLDQLQQELEHWKEKYEMLELDHGILTTELSDPSSVSSTGGFRVQQLEQQNSKLKDGLVQMRDMVASMRHEQQQKSKELDRLSSEHAEVTRARTHLEERLQHSEHTVADLQEQLDMALGAEEMVEYLTEKNLALEEKVRELREAVDDLEKLQDVNDQLQEQARETELELREEVEMARAQVVESHRRLEALAEALANTEQMVGRYRELTAQLRNQASELEHQQQQLLSREEEEASLTATSSVAATADLRAQALAVDLELRRLDAAQATRHVDYLCSFLPEAFLARDHEAILMLLLVSRLSAKCEIVAAQVRHKFPAPPGELAAEAVLGRPETERHAYGNHVLFLLYELQGLLRQYECALNTCSVELFTKTATLYPEMVAQEKLVDLYLQLLRRDELDEHVPLENLEKVLSYFHSLYAVHLSSERVDGAHLLGDNLRSLSAAADAAVCSLGAIRVLLPTTGDAMAWLDESLALAKGAQQTLRRARRRLPASACLEVGSELREELREVCRGLGRAAAVALALHRSAVAHATQSPPLSADKLKELSHEATDRVYGKDDDGPERLREAIAQSQQVAQRIAALLQSGELERQKEPMPEPPVNACAQAARQQARDVDALRAKLESRDADIVALRKALKIKSEEYSEMHVRKDMAEKKLELSARDTDDRVDKLQRQLDETKILLRRKEKEFEETLDHLQADIDALEAERGELKDKLKLVSKKTLYKGLAEAAGGVPAPSWPHLQDLRVALAHTQRERARLMLRRAEALTSGARPLSAPSSSGPLHDALRRLARAQSGTVQLCANARVVDLAKDARGRTLVDQRVKALEAARVLSDTRLEVASEAPGAHVAAHWRGFPSPALGRALRNEGDQFVGRLCSAGASQTSAAPLLLDGAALRRLHTQLVA
ncbi:dynactin subunit 1-like [Ornithodoros turicata]|uniref:dynactin subunit 1-like n=1 Tax=Ornithodoros turicata TaxID=34597 RepID=UPI00313864F8